MSNHALSLVRLRAPNAGPLTGPGTNTFVVGSDGACIVIDPGCEDADHLAAIRASAASVGELRAILITHGHPDHMGGAATLAAQVKAPVLAMSNTEQGVAFADVVLADNQRIPVGTEEFIVLATPGHRFDHCCLWHQPSGILFAGDLVASTGTIVIIPPEGDMGQYLASLERLQALALTRIWPAHGEAIDDPHAHIAGYIIHRLERERKVLLALASAGEPRTVAQLLPLVYADTDPALYAWAAKSLQAHLLKLEADGRIKRDPGADYDGPWESC